MATEVTSKTSSPHRPSPAPLPSSTLASRPVDGVLQSSDLRGPEKTSDQAMQTFSREQTRYSSAAPSLTPARVSTSVSDDLDDILTAALAEDPGAAVAGTESGAQGSQKDSGELKLLADYLSLQHFLTRIAFLKSDSLFKIVEPKDTQEEIARVGQQINNLLCELNLFFKELLEKGSSTKSWVEKKTQDKCSPFATSTFLLVHLEKATALKPYLNKAQVEDWKKLYPKAVIHLKQEGLEAHNKTAFPFDHDHQEMLTMLELVDSNPMGRQAVEEFAANPEQVQQKLAEFTKAVLQPSMEFFQRLDALLQQNPQNREPVEAWLKSEVSKSDYPAHFYNSDEILDRIARDPLTQSLTSHLEFKTLFDRCCQKLKALGLQQYVQEGPPREQFEELKAAALSDKEKLEEWLQNSSAFFWAIADFLQKLPPGPESNDANRAATEKWLAEFRANPDFAQPHFFIAQGVQRKMGILREVLDPALLEDFQQHYSECCARLNALGLEKIVNETPVAEPSSAPQEKEMTLTERMENELEFFQLLLEQEEANLEQWLQENSPLFDYPLLWGQKRSTELSELKVEAKLKEEWEKNWKACVKKLRTPALRPHLNIKEAPEDASPELCAFLGLPHKYQPLWDALEAAIKTPQDPASLHLCKHLRFYLKTFPGKLETVIPSKLLIRVQGAFNGKLSEEGIPLPPDATLLAARTFFQNLLKKHTAEGSDKARAWVADQKAAPGYSFPFYIALYGQSIGSSHNSLKLLELFYEKMVAWTHEIHDENLLLEMPPDISQGFCQLVHAVTADLRKSKLKQEKPQEPEKKQEFQVSSVRPSIDDQVFRRFVAQVVPRLTPLLDKPAMYVFWKNNILDMAESTVVTSISVFQEVQKAQSKRQLIQYLNRPKQFGYAKITLISKDNLPLADQLAPLISSPLMITTFKEEYKKCCAHVRRLGIPDKDYIDVELPPFLSDTKQCVASLQHELSLAIQFFEEAEKQSNEALALWMKSTIEQIKIYPFWLSRYLPDLCTGWGGIQLKRGDVEKLKRVYANIQPRLARLHLEYFLDEQPPVTNRANLAKVVNSI